MHSFNVCFRSRVKLESIAEELNVSTNDVEPILVKCILDGTLVDAKIDQGKGILVRKGANGGNSGTAASGGNGGNGGSGGNGGGMDTQWDALSKWADAIANLNEN